MSIKILINHNLHWLHYLNMYKINVTDGEEGCFLMQFAEKPQKTLAMCTLLEMEIYGTMIVTNMDFMGYKILKK